MSRIKVAIAQIASELGDIQRNIKKHLEYIDAARAQQVNVLLFPELSLTGYDLGNTAPDIALEFDDTLLGQLAEASGDMTTIVGFVELGFAAQLHNTALAVRDGAPIFLHRKLNLPNYGKLEEGKHFGNGRYVETFALQRPWHASVLICADVWNPALVHLVTVKGATVLFIPINSARGTVSTDFSNPDGWELTVRFYARMYGMPIVMANRVGEEAEYTFWGRSMILNPQGSIIAEAGSDSEELLVSELEYNDVIVARAQLPTVRDSNLDLIHREIDRLRDTIGHPNVLFDT